MLINKTLNNEKEFFIREQVFVSSSLLADE